MDKGQTRRRALVVDDDPFALKLLTHQLKQLGYDDVIGHERAATALAALAAAAPEFDTIICDLEMPEMDGVEFIRHLGRATFGGGLILVSGEDRRVLQSVERLALGHRLNVLGAIQKPVTAADLAAALEHLVANEKIRPRYKAFGASRLRQALEKRELINHYQPQVRVDTGEFVGVEALVRWQHPEHGLIYPDQFIGVAEDFGLIDCLTAQVLVQALIQLRSWDDCGCKLNLSVNVSMDNLADLDFPDFVNEQAALNGIRTSRLVLEVTESQLMKDPLASLDILLRLRLKRVGLSIDDFGTGHSSLAQLRDIPFSELKIDRGFTHGAAENASLRAIFNASLGMASQLEIGSVAEGVEDLADWQFLQRARCQLAQGYFIGKPMPPTALIDWLETWNARRPELCPASGSGSR